MAGTYRLFIGAPYCMCFVTFGVLLCVTVVGIPVGLAMIAVGLKYLIPEKTPNWRFSAVCFRDGTRVPSLMILVGLLLSVTIVGLPVGLPLIALGFKRLMAPALPA